mmetsp:Transcript_7407/g.20564  ORF Transcript_7407/g.20564 Transcript_7407/m.20564 type:complete len:377 (-) Transcript_7407:152-1282(-)
MGKKSKKGGAKAKAKAGISSSASAASSGCATASDTTGTSIVTATTGNKKEKCVRCFGNLKDLAKAHQCPGCSHLFCWRCEKKVFEECPNGSRCVVPSRRCTGCSMGGCLDTLIDVHERRTGSTVPSEMRLPLFGEYLAGRGDFDLLGATIDGYPFQQCGGRGCSTTECYRCLTDTADRRLVQCAVCHRVRCLPCTDVDIVQGEVPTEFEVAWAGPAAIAADQISRAADALRRDTPEHWAKCGECDSWYCFGCLDDGSARSLALALFAYIRQLQLDDASSDTNDFQCSRCYWSAKPCTNPTCPNENKVGIPTKRCGGCHIDRYCSVECQAAAYPAHVERCQKIQSKRTAAEYALFEDCVEWSVSEDEESNTVEDSEE